MKYTERLSKCILTLISLAIITAVCIYFNNILSYIAIAAVITLIGKPLISLMCKAHIGRHHMPSWLAAVIAIILEMGFLAGIIIIIVPLVSSIISDISMANVENISHSMSVPLAEFNRTLVSWIPNLGSDFRIEATILEHLQNFLNIDTVTSIVGSVASFLAGLGVAVFAVVFIAFFFMKKPGMLTNILLAITPDKYEQNMKHSIAETGRLVSRYIIGLVMEVFGVTLINFLGLLLVARMGFGYSLGIAFLTGMLNIIPYLGPLFGCILGVSLSVTIKFVCATSFGLNVGFAHFVAILLGIFMFAQLVDNYVFQPVIYSNSVKAHPLEIFIVLLIAGHIGGIIGMLIAIPTYTVARVVAKEFFGDHKMIRLLTGSDNQ